MVFLFLSECIIITYITQLKCVFWTCKISGFSLLLSKNYLKSSPLRSTVTTIISSIIPTRDDSWLDWTLRPFHISALSCLSGSLLPLQWFESFSVLDFTSTFHHIFYSCCKSKPHPLLWPLLSPLHLIPSWRSFPSSAFFFFWTSSLYCLCIWHRFYHSLDSNFTFHYLVMPHCAPICNYSTLVLPSLNNGHHNHPPPPLHISNMPAFLTFLALSSCTLYCMNPKWSWEKGGSMWAFGTLTQSKECS